MLGTTFLSSENLKLGPTSASAAGKCPIKVWTEASHNNAASSAGSPRTVAERCFAPFFEDREVLTRQACANHLPYVMDKAALLTLGAVILTVSITSLTYDTAAVFQRPIHSAITALLVSGVSVLGLHYKFPGIFASSGRPHNYTALPLKSPNLPHAARSPSPEPFASSNGSSRSVQRLLFLIAIFAVCFRVEVFRQVQHNGQCATPGVEGCVPFILALYDYRQVRRKRAKDSGSRTSNIVRLSIECVVHDQFKYIIPASLLSAANIFSAIASSGHRSTYICPVAQSTRFNMSLLQILGSVLDCAFLISITELLARRNGDGSTRAGKSPAVVGTIFLCSGILLSVAGSALFFAVPHDRDWILGVNGAYVSSVAWQTSLATFTVIAIVRMGTSFGTLTVAMVVSFVCTYSLGLAYAWVNRTGFPPILQLSTAISVILLFLGAALFLSAATSSEASDMSQPKQRLVTRRLSFVYTIFFLLLTIRGFLELPRSNVITTHPIDTLIHDATQQHQSWLAQGSVSKTLLEATQEYQRRYHRHPPPGFDHWYTYATNRSSVIIDDYDSIYKDLSPFWAIDPTIIRARTREIIANPWNEVAEVKIRSGRAEMGPNVVPTHRWMLDGVIAMLDKFVQHLPDMDLAFNINDESRVAVPYHTMQSLLKTAADTGSLTNLKRNEWSPKRSETWEPIDETNLPRTPFEDHSFTNNFYTYGSISCPPSSPARRLHIWDPRTLCTTCASPHSIGPFLSNWTLAASPCHQPDLASLHGFYLSPAAFKTSHTLLPVFSQSKPHGYADILYPSPWNYMDKAEYAPTTDALHPDPPYAEKVNTLFWRGATSEGVSAEGTWKGMVRQRLVHLANNLTSSSKIPILLPYPSNPAHYLYQYLPSSLLTTLGLRTDIAIVDTIVRCGLLDCPDQRREFGTVAHTDFQDHWRYRYLFDMDGAGFSGRFIPFLQSKSLPFKTALFREWYDSRITAWKHFVPLDMRLQGVWSTLAYFSGTKAWKGGLGMKERVEEGGRIAQEGREWAGKVLRKEDMEVYFFRLLLEWGRLTDEGRDGIGFVVDE